MVRTWTNRTNRFRLITYKSRIFANQQITSGGNLLDQHPVTRVVAQIVWQARLVLKLLWHVWIDRPVGTGRSSRFAGFKKSRKTKLFLLELGMDCVHKHVNQSYKLGVN